MKIEKFEFVRDEGLRWRFKLTLRTADEYFQWKGTGSRRYLRRAVRRICAHHNVVSPV